MNGEKPKTVWKINLETEYNTLQHLLSLYKDLTLILAKLYHIDPATGLIVEKPAEHQTSFAVFDEQPSTKTISFILEHYLLHTYDKNSFECWKQINDFLAVFAFNYKYQPIPWDGQHFEIGYYVDQLLQKPISFNPAISQETFTLAKFLKMTDYELIEKCNGLVLPTKISTRCAHEEHIQQLVEEITEDSKQQPPMIKPEELQAIKTRKQLENEIQKTKNYINIKAPFCAVIANVVQDIIFGYDLMTVILNRITGIEAKRAISDSIEQAQSPVKLSGESLKEALNPDLAMISKIMNLFPAENAYRVRQLSSETSTRVNHRIFKTPAKGFTKVEIILLEFEELFPQCISPIETTSRHITATEVLVEVLQAFDKNQNYEFLSPLVPIIRDACNQIKSIRQKIIADLEALTNCTKTSEYKNTFAERLALAEAPHPT